MCDTKIRQKENLERFFLPEYFLYFCTRKSYPDKQSDADHGNWNGRQPITLKMNKLQSVKNT